MAASTKYQDFKKKFEDDPDFMDRLVADPEGVLRNEVKITDPDFIAVIKDLVDAFKNAPGAVPVGAGPVTGQAGDKFYPI